MTVSQACLFNNPVIVSILSVQTMKTIDNSFAVINSLSNRQRARATATHKLLTSLRTTQSHTTSTNIQSVSNQNTARRGDIAGCQKGVT